MNNIANISITSILAGSVLYFIFGALWFTPLFGKIYDDSLGFLRPKGYKWAPIFYWMPLLSSILCVTIISWLHVTMKPTSILDSMFIGAVVGLVGLSVSFNNAVTPNKPSPLKHGSVTGFYHLIASVLAAVAVYIVS